MKIFSYSNYSRSNSKGHYVCWNGKHSKNTYKIKIKANVACICDELKINN